MKLKLNLTLRNKKQQDCKIINDAAAYCLTVILSSHDKGCVICVLLINVLSRFM